MEATTSKSLAAAIQEGSFPDSDTILSSDLSSTIPALIDSIQDARNELNTSIKDISKGQASDVDSWITQAKKVQDEIARCKEDAAQIVQEHERILALRSTRAEARSKVKLLEEEISFNEALERQIRLISATSQSLNTLDNDISQQRFVHAAKAVPTLRATVISIPSGQCQLLLSQLQSDLTQSLQGRLKAELDTRCQTRLTDAAAVMRLSGTSTHDEDHQEPSVQPISSDDVLDCLETLDALDEARAQIVKKVENSLLPHLHKRSKLKILKGHIQDHELHFELIRDSPPPAQLSQALKVLFQYIDGNSPSKLKQQLLAHLAHQIIPLLIVNWLDTAVPAELERLHELDELQDEVRHLALTLKQCGLKESSDLEAWINQLPKTWVAKRRMVSLDAVRNAFKKATRATRSVERIERQTAVIEQEQPKSDTADDHWAQSWDDNDEKPSDGNAASDAATGDDSDAWGFDTDDQDNEPQKPAQDVMPAEIEEEGEAWGWDDDEEPTKPTVEPEKETPAHKVNGIKEQPLQNRQQDTVLTESYTVTDIPDYVLDQIRADISDLQVLQSSPGTYFRTTATLPTGLQNFPPLILAMFRATSPTHYQNFGLSNMNLYNDVLYLIDGVSTLTAANPGLSDDLPSLQRFARATYASELTLQRTILHDLLDSAQGFVSCTKPPYAAVCDDAISSVTDHLRNLHAQWEPILSPSHLHQAIGSLLSSVMSKIIQDIKDMDDISELESQKLVSFCERVSALQDLFVHQGSTVSQVAFHVPAYFRFGYLQEILGGTLLHIKELWEQGGLSEEFEKEEVVDMIKALFAESSHRRNAIHAIRG
ncbi:ribosome biogenesis protein ytm1 [Neophaeococcomyces mojaviensis]|uniref:Ribosome biogenesis protein ytm1 n=1 Tax=Neophaeococcomyces mojaviensis TaxID=3383035 RepID=A0ACC2ZZA2_9EURO|nr:ribosome biogenesis protein ytm1 [Knufia sp. JES_112]